MAKNWESIRADVCKHYHEGKSLTQVRQIMLQERNFKASARSYRLKLAKWKAKRSDVELDQHHANTGMAIGKITQTYAMPSSLVSLTFQNHTPHKVPLGCGTPNLFDNVQSGQFLNFIDSTASINTSCTNDQSHMPRDAKFDQVIQRMHEVPSGHAYEAYMSESDLNSGRNTLLNYVAARGFMADVMANVLGFYMCQKNSLEFLNNALETALHIAVAKDRVDNVRLLLSYGAKTYEQNSLGELPLHVAVRTTKNPELIDLLLLHKNKDIYIYAPFGNGAKALVCSPSKDAGKVTLDLLIERVLYDVTHSGKPECTHATKEIILKILPWASTIDDTTYLREHARHNHERFGQAIEALGKHILVMGLRWTMMEVFRDEVSKKDPKFYRNFCHRQAWPSGQA